MEEPEILDVEGEALTDLQALPAPADDIQLEQPPMAAERLPERPPEVSEDDKRRGRVFARAFQVMAEAVTGKRLDDDSEGVAAEACADLSSEVMPMLPKWGRVAVILVVLGLPMAATFLNITEGGRDNADS